MVYTVVSAGFQYVIETDYVGFYINIRVCYGVSYTCLGCQVHHDIELIGIEEGINEGSICNISLYKRKVPVEAFNLFESIFPKAFLFERMVSIIFS